jgi:hypothetical protein
MSRTTDYILDQEDRGELVYDDSRHEYVTPKVYTLRENIEYLEWQIQSLKNDIKIKRKELNTNEM